MRLPRSPPPPLPSASSGVSTRSRRRSASPISRRAVHGLAFYLRADLSRAVAEAGAGQLAVLIPAVFFMGALHFALIFTGAKLSDASTMAIVNQLYVPIAVLLAMFWLGETVPWRRWLGIAAAFPGVVVFSLDASVASHPRACSPGARCHRWGSAPCCCAGCRHLALRHAGLDGGAGHSVLFSPARSSKAARSRPVDAPWQGWAALAYTVIAAA